jgi:negative regulator of the PHO system
VHVNSRSWYTSDRSFNFFRKLRRIIGPLLLKKFFDRLFASGFSRKKQQQMIGKYKRLEEIGAGTYATVFKAVDESTGKFVALKEIRLNPEEGAPSTALREISFMRELSHPNIVRLIEVIHTSKSLCLVFELLQQDLKHLLDSRRSLKKSFSLAQIQSVMYQILSGLAFCHDRKILHRDLKPQNLLLSAEGHVKLADFGLARGYGIPVNAFSSEVVTLWYRPPDILLGSTNYTTPIDIWSVGCIMAELVLLQPLFPGKNNQDQIQCIFKILGTPSLELLNYLTNNTGIPSWIGDFPFYQPTSWAKLFPSLPPAGLNLIARMLDYRPTMRISAKEALEHSFFSDLPFKNNNNSSSNNSIQ